MEPWLATAARRLPERPAVIGSEEALSYSVLYARALRACAWLRERGVQRGDRVAVALPGGPDFAAALHGAWLAGAAVVPVDLRLTEAERAARAGDAALVIDALPGADGEGDVGEKLPYRPISSHAPPEQVELDDPAAVLHTSGTTAAPKPVVLSFRNFLASALGSAVALGLEAGDRWLCPMPLVHVGGLSVLARSAIYGTAAVLHERFDTERVLSELSDPARGITIASLVPTMLARLLDAGLTRPPSLRRALLGGGPIAPALLERAEAAGVPVAPTYGMTEACSQIATDGWPLPGVEVRFAPGGEILVRGDTVARGALDADGWLHTGDLGAWDEHGRLEIVGRASDTIVSGGENVAPTEVEAVLLEHPGIADAGVFPRPDPEWGEAVVAAVVARDLRGVSFEELRGHCAVRLAPFKVPKEFRLVEALPRTPSGKLLRRHLRDV